MSKSRFDVIARIRWYTEAEGGRRILPTGRIYGTNVYFEKDSTLWSAVILLEQNVPVDRIQDVKIGFFVREYLEKELVVGKQIFICEGPVRIVAEGEIISVNEKPH